MGIFLAIAIALTLFMSVRIHGLFSFVTLGAIGAAIYSIPGVIDAHVPFYGKRSGLLYPTPTEADLMVLLAWVALFAGVFLFRPKAAVATEETPEVVQANQRDLITLGYVSAGLAIAGYLYLAWWDGWFFFLDARGDQAATLTSLLWKWTVVVSLVAAILTRSRALLLFSLLMLFLIFLRGDRTMIAVTAAASIAALAQVRGNWVNFLAPKRLIPILAAAFLVLFGKSSWITLKSGLSGQGWVAPDIPLANQFIFQFEPFATYAHIGHVMDFNVTIGFGEFAQSILANVLIFPSLFGFDTNIYNEVVTSTLPPTIRYGVAGNFIAHGWTVAGPVGVFAFALTLCGAWRLCDSQFARRHGVVKLFWGCTGGVLSFYAHRNGFDNLFSFIRQVIIVCFMVFMIALPFKEFLPGQRPGARRRPVAVPRVGPSAWSPVVTLTPQDSAPESGPAGG